MEISVVQILAARDKRAATQKRLLEAFGKRLVCFTMNIAGPVKYSPVILRGFQLGKQLLETALGPVLHFEESLCPTGCEAFYVVDTPAKELKQLCVTIEDSASERATGILMNSSRKNMPTSRRVAIASMLILFSLLSSRA